MTDPAFDRDDFASLDYYRLTYADRTGETAARNVDLADGDLSITWPNGFTIWIPKSESQTLLGFLTRTFDFKASRKHRFWASLKRDNAGPPGRGTGVRIQPITHEKEGHQP